MRRPKTIGLVGGLSWVSTAEYYRRINAEYQRRLGGLRSAPMALVSLDFQEIVDLQAAGRRSAIAAMMAEAGRRLRRAGADFVVLASNTAHLFAADVARASRLPVLHVADAAAAEAARLGVRSVAVLGTRHTMESDLYPARLERLGVACLTPAPARMRALDTLIFGKLCRGDFSAGPRRRVVALLEELRGRGAEGAILACTELGLLLERGAARRRWPLLDTLALHARAAVDAALAP